MEETNMSRTFFATLVTVVAISMATSTLAQQSQGGAASPVREGAVPSQLDAEQIKQMQLKLNQLGFSSGHVDGIWGPETSTAVLHFQQISHLQATGKLNDETFKALGQPGTVTVYSAAAAQAVPPQATPAPLIPAPAIPAPAIPALGAPTQSAPTTGTSAGATGGRATDSTSDTGTSPNSPVPVLNAPASNSGAASGASPGGNGGRVAAGDANNQAVATTSANAPQPAHGANSFTKGEAQRRIAREGFQNVGDLSKDNADVWRGRAVKNGQSARVWLDYKGNVGQE